MTQWTAIDLFAGLGGLSEGARMADVFTIWAGNHWRMAVDTHARNHPRTLHACQDLQQQNWAEVPAHNLLLAAPACQGHTPARGKDRPHHDAQRSTAWAVVAAAECHRPDAFIVENVPAFAQWQLYPAWCAAMHALGYAQAPMVLDAANHGVAQHRRRLFIVGTRSKHPITLDLPRQAHIGCEQIIDFNAGQWSPIDKPGRSLATLARIRAGRAAHGHRFVAPYYGSGSGLTGRSLQKPIGTITTRDRWAVIDGDRMRMLSVDESRKAMGFPSTYQLPERAKDAMHMLGNAVVPMVARDVINALRLAA